MKRLALLVALFLSLGTLRAASVPLANAQVLIDPATGLLLSLPVSGAPSGATSGISMTAISGQAATSYYDKLTSAANTKITAPNQTDRGTLVRAIPRHVTQSAVISVVTSGTSNANPLVAGVGGNSIVVTKYSYSGDNIGRVSIYSVGSATNIAYGHNGPYSGEALSLAHPLQIPVNEAILVDAQSLSGASTTFFITIQYYLE
jgi:subtilisin family serine protease